MKINSSLRFWTCRAIVFLFVITLHSTLFALHSAASDVTFKSADGTTLAGSLEGLTDKSTIGVVLVSGSGQQDRDETLMGHKPMKAVSDYLTAKGIAVLRYDDRGVGGSEKGSADITTDVNVADAEAALALLRQQKGLKKFGVIGHSEGGMVAFILASQHKCDFLVSLAGPAVKGRDILAAQQAAIYKTMNLPQAAIDQNSALFKEIFDMVEKAADIPSLENDIRGYFDGLGVPEEQTGQVVQQICTPWMVQFLKSNPSEAIQKTDCPALILNGSKDTQVVPEQNISAYLVIAKVYKKNNWVIKELPGLNHLFLECQTGSPTEYQSLQGSFSTDALNSIGDFISKL